MFPAVGLKCRGRSRSNNKSSWAKCCTRNFFDVDFYERNQCDSIKRLQPRRQGHWLAIEKGLAEATWYASPVPKEQMRELLKRRDWPALRDSLIWFTLLIGSGCAAYQLWQAGSGGRSCRS